MERELYHPILDKFVPYSEEAYSWLCEGGEIEHLFSDRLHKLRKIADKEVLYIHGMAYIPLIEGDDEDALEAEAHEVITFYDNEEK